MKMYRSATLRARLNVKHTRDFSAKFNKNVFILNSQTGVHNFTNIFRRNMSSITLAINRQIVSRMP